MSSSPRGWNPETPEQTAAREAAAKADHDDFARLHAAVFTGASGRELLEAYHRMHVDAVLGPETSHSALSFREGQRQVVRQLERLTAEGLKAK